MHEEGDIGRIYKTKIIFFCFERNIIFGLKLDVFFTNLIINALRKLKLFSNNKFFFRNHKKDRLVLRVVFCPQTNIYLSLLLAIKFRDIKFGYCLSYLKLRHV